MQHLLYRPYRKLEDFAARHAIFWSVLWAVIGSGGTLVAAGFFKVPFGAPPDSGSDAIFLLLLSKAALLGSGFVHLPFLGYPEGADFSYFPTFDITQLAILEWLAKFLDTPFEIWTAFHITVTVIGFLTIYILFLTLTANAVHASILAFGCMFFAFTQRMTGHNFLYANYSVACGVYLIIFSVSKEAITTAKSVILGALQTYIIPIFFIFIVSLSGVYYTFFFLSILSFLLLFNLLVGGGGGLQRGIAVIVATILVFMIAALLIYPETFFNPAVFSPRRSPFEQPEPALRISDALLEFAKNRYNGAMPFHSGKIVKYADWRQVIEGFDAFSGPFVTLVVLAAPFLVPLSKGGFVRTWFESDKRYQSLLYLAALSILFIFLFATPYGYGFLFGEFVTAAFRSQNRISPFMNIFGVILLYGGVSFICKRKDFFIILSLIVIMGFNGTGRYNYWRNYYRSLSPSNSANLESAARIDSLLKPSSETYVLQLPYADFPEVPMIKDFQPYQHLLLPIVFANNDIRKMPHWSYAAVTAQMAHKLGAKDIGMPLVENWSKNAACMGYTNIVLEKRAYDTLPDPDRSLWKLVYDDTLRQLWERIPSTSSIECITQLSLDFRRDADRLLLSGEDRVWHVDEVGGYLKGASGEIALPLYGVNKQDVCLHVAARLINRIDKPERNKRLYLSLGNSRTEWTIDGETADIEFDARVDKGQWRNNFLFMSVAQTDRKMSWHEWLKAWFGVNKTMVGLQTLDVQTESCKS